ncbi:MAG: sigma-E factor negative regulatory protein [Cellvibrionaceae bacterium]
MSKQSPSKQEYSSKQQLSESLSALMDGEATEMELRRILKSSEADKESIDERWMRYHLASDAMKGEVELQSSMDFSASISAAIADEPTYSSASTKKKEKSAFWPNLGRFAVAASVAGAVVVGVQFAPTETGGAIATTPSPITNTPGAIASNPNFGPETSVRAVGNQAPSEQQKPIVINEATQEQLQKMEGEINRLMLEHAQDGSQNTQQGVLPYVRVPDAEQ